MHSQEYNCVDKVNELLRKLRIRETQLKLAKIHNMSYTSQILENQISELQHQLSEAKDPEIHALMSLLDD
ncbi:hypothetical protein [Umezakia ovalisporum]|jgi:hypothetical protein|uniref:Uncharacterized protein n=2 Tax=Umezakia ovalisporum TaxID=75695 RepID=A0AA43H0S3_9CYAN|nr:hypothetical protein [Umezakia ovalisporum]MBI1240459.1 hypothetical protein [Nostoc sp. RI_552]MDH6055934.1 hypothetical protein [Umezakia ovalisporum FSS-43]MDH6065344.1 hypothetical protein [Umezakia ovalisporum FSS-62]MDH6066172.1 hypothetical protein [Umezakia ovalisporum APH033B]MDH6072566.1 hypothetical protein [Umezakia ovalisporum CobakiLakeA]